MNRTITPRQIIEDGGLPNGVTGVHWRATNFTECAKHVEFAALNGGLGEDDLNTVGDILTDEVECGQEHRGRPPVGAAISVKYPAELLARVDAAAEGEGITRAEWLRRAAEQAL